MNLMKAFEAMMLDGNVTRAAARIGLAQPSMSNALGRLRALFDDPLFVRTPDGMHPTPRARAIAPLIASALAALRSAINEVGRFDPAASDMTVRMATTDYGEFVLLPHVLKLLRASAPKLKLVCVTPEKEASLAHLERGNIDIVVNVLPSVPDRVRSRRLFAERFVCISRRKHPAIKGRLTLKSFLKLRHALVAPGGTPRGPVDRALAALGHERSVVMSVGSFISLPFLIADCDLVAVVAERIARRLATAAALDIHELPFQIDGFMMSMAWAGGTDKDPGQMWVRDLLGQAGASLGDATATGARAGRRTRPGS